MGRAEGRVRVGVRAGESQRKAGVGRGRESARARERGDGRESKIARGRGEGGEGGEERERLIEGRRERVRRDSQGERW